ncbi:MAG: septum formation inhibitor Maf [Rhodocyclales bacterium]|nr:septum formation inhibitor Maf [Rhodocyclales bacterium]
MQKRIYLASTSPRRRELLRQIGVHFNLLLARHGAREDGNEVDETPLPGERVEDYVDRIARTKAESGYRRLRWRHLPVHPVLAADTTLAVDDEIIGKPASPEHAREILCKLSGRTHRVLSAVAICDATRCDSLTNVSEVTFRTLSESDIRHYIASGEPMDKAGAYGIQGRAAVFITEIHGSYSGIMGLPLCETALLLEAFGYPLHT